MRKIAFGLILLGLALYLVNASWLASPSGDGEYTIISHRGVHQTYDRSDLKRDTCTASLIHPPEHSMLENTIPSMEAAFAAGATVVEIDIHPTTDGRFAVFHDWTVDCRTNGTGVTRDHSLTELKALDIGYGYTADEGKTFPFRGKARETVPSLEEVFKTFPDGQFLINFKSNDVTEADRLHALLEDHPSWRPRVWGVYGGAAPTQQMEKLVPGMRGFTTADTKNCVKAYVALGWSGYVPESCRHMQVLVPSNYAKWLWGWPNRFLKRMADHDTEVVLAGPPKGTGGLDTLEQLEFIPDGFSGYIWTNKIETTGPALGKN
ncbi:MAG: glycerophosphodiester phosphodiesterase [Roseibium sp.]|uniref:glycerophosphodiester phosphodiesterase family protein n=1 Tax=Roseibium sp. TaxID=1936156 RepID=UPI00260D5B67|nr:glycerophosphodiester phosphodiesterase family protein [Roseibium sp.]MCV0426809.1 glycerophosphodiester phosphodiesterase [Roseibium sp.]